MPARKKPDDEPSPQSARLSDTARGLLSLAIVVQLFFILLVTTGNFGRSSLQDRTLGLFRPWVQLLNFEQLRVPYHLTHGVERDLTQVDHQIEFLPAGADADDPDAWEVIGRRSHPLSESALRYQRLAAMAAFHAEQDEKTLAALAATGLTRRYAAEHDALPDRVRLRRKIVVPEAYLPQQEQRRLGMILGENEAAYLPYTAQIVPRSGDQLAFDVIAAAPESQAAPVVDDDESEDDGGDGDGGDGNGQGSDGNDASEDSP